MSSVGARKQSEISAVHLAALNAGQAESRTLSEALAIDQVALCDAVLPHAPEGLRETVAAAGKLGILKRMAATGAALLKHLPPEQLDTLATHQSDTVRGWWCFALGADTTISTLDLLARAKPLANDHSFAVREWVWMALRPRLVDDLETAIELLVPWTADPAENVRRFASESLRPRGVWASHIGVFKTHPALAEPLLEPLRADPSRYVQDSVANWINDASKTAPEWAIEICQRWTEQSAAESTARIVKRALRSIK